MNCDYCGKNMPKSYTYEVGGTVDCGCRMDDGGWTKQDDLSHAYRSMDRYALSIKEKDQRIAELQYQYREMFLLRGMALKRIDELKEQLNDRRKGGE